MDITARREIMVLILALTLFLSLLYPAMMHARREARDGLRRDEVAAFKRVLEQYYNEYETYPLEFDAAPHQYVVMESSEQGATAWYLRAHLENNHETATAHDAEEGRQYDFRLIRDGDRTYYEVCGGMPTCDLDDPR